jgi:hypothetical protein
MRVLALAGAMAAAVAVGVVGAPLTSCVGGESYACDVIENAAFIPQLQLQNGVALSLSPGSSSEIQPNFEIAKFFGESFAANTYKLSVCANGYVQIATNAQILNGDVEFKCSPTIEPDTPLQNALRFMHTQWDMMPSDRRMVAQVRVATVLNQLVIDVSNLYLTGAVYGVDTPAHIQIKISSSGQINYVFDQNVKQAPFYQRVQNGMLKISISNEQEIAADTIDYTTTQQLQLIPVELPANTWALRYEPIVA